MAAERIEDVYPMTPMQEGMLLHTLLEPGTGLYYMQDRYRINSALDPQRFARAWQAVIARHEALRASFCWSVGEAMLQIIHRPAPPAIDYLDWSAEPEEAAKRVCRHCINRSARPVSICSIRPCSTCV